MTNNEKLFRLLGWEFKNNYIEVGSCQKYEHLDDTWVDLNGYGHYELPDAENDFEACREHVIPAMREKDYCYEIRIKWSIFDGIERPYFIWQYTIKDIVSEIEIIDDNIPAALVESTIQVLEKEKT